MRVGIYVRQSVREDDGIEQQKTECTAEVERRGWTVEEVYIDNDVSASKDRGDGTAWAGMLADIDAGRIDCIMVVAVDRLMRRIADVLEVTSPRRNVRVMTVRGNIDTGDSMGAFILSLFVLVAEQEIRIKSVRAIPYRQGRNANGHPSPGKVPYGYRWVAKLHRDAKGRRYEIVSEEAAVVRFVFSEVIAGSPLGMIARELNQGTARDPETDVALLESTETRTGSAWSATTVRRIALSPYYAALLPPIVPGAGVYRAELVDLDACTPGIWEPIIGADAVRASRAILMNDPRHKGHGKGTSRRWLLSGLALCDVCGARVRSSRTKEKNHGYRCPHGHFQRAGSIWTTTPNRS
jgi:DNA invertase Pin-like site-specific DNA recombinase